MNATRHLHVIALLLASLFGHPFRLSAQDPSANRDPAAESTALFAPEVMERQDDPPIELAGGVLNRRSDVGFSSQKLKKLMRPTIGLRGEWYAEADQVQLATYEAGITIPTYPIFGPPPPMIKFGFGYTDLDSPSEFDLPGKLYESSIGLSWMRRKNERWMFRSMIGAANASDGDNQSSDSWQFRGGIFAMYQPKREWIWTFGAIALGRNDIPVVPAVGLIYQPNPSVRFDLAFPRPRASFLLTDDGVRQHWGYIGAGLNGGTWAYERTGGMNDQLTYRDWQFALGIESTPRKEPGIPFARGRKFGAEIGYAFAREFEFDSGLPDIQIGDTLMLRAIADF